MSSAVNRQVGRTSSLGLSSCGPVLECNACLGGSGPDPVLSKDACAAHVHVLCLSCTRLAEFCVICTASSTNADKPRQQEAAALLRDLQSQRLAQEQAAD